MNIGDGAFFANVYGFERTSVCSPIRIAICVYVYTVDV